jgi:hypothetical protein
MVAHEALHTPGIRLLFRVQTNLVEEAVRNNAARFGCALCRAHAWGNCTRLLWGLDKSHNALLGQNNKRLSLSLRLSTTQHCSAVFAILRLEHTIVISEADYSANSKSRCHACYRLRGYGAISLSSIIRRDAPWAHISLFFDRLADN